MNRLLRREPEPQPRDEQGKFQSLDQGPRGGTPPPQSEMNSFLRGLAGSR